MFKIKKKLPPPPRPAYNGWWNGEPAVVRIVRIVVGKSPVPTWWCAKFEGQEREAVEVRYKGDTFYLDNQYNAGWRKVTEGRGSPMFAHKSLPAERVLSAVTSIAEYRAKTDQTRKSTDGSGSAGSHE